MFRSSSIPAMGSMPKEPEADLAPLQKRVRVPPAQTLPMEPSAKVIPPKISQPEPQAADEEFPDADADSEELPPPPRSLVSVMLVFLALAIVGGVVVHFASKELAKNVKPQPILAAVGNHAMQEANYLRIGWQKDAYDLLRGFLSAPSVEEKLPFILNPEALGPKLASFYGGDFARDGDTPAEAFSAYELEMEDRQRGLFMMIYDQPPQFRMREFFRPLASLEVQYGIEEADMLLSTVARAGNFAMEPVRAHAFFKRTAQGLRLDWELFAQTKYRTLRQFVDLSTSGKIEVFRVLIVEDVPDKGQAVAGTRTYRIEDPANPGDNARINVRVDSEIGRALSKINWRGTKDKQPLAQTATVELQWSGDANDPELVISRFVCWEFLGLGGEETTSL